MLLFTYPQEVDHEAKRLLKDLLQKETGQKCIILDMDCTGVYYVPDGSDQLKEMCGSKQLPQSPL